MISIGSVPFVSFRNPEKPPVGLSWKSIVLIFLFCSINSFSQATFNWNKSQSTGTSDESAYGIAVDSVNKFIYTCGSIGNSGAFSGLVSSDMNNGGGNGALDAFLAKHDFNGNLIWVVNMGSTNNDEARSLCIAPDGNIYLTGYHIGPMRFKSIGSPNFTLSASSGNNDVFVSSYTSNGKFRWAKHGGGTQEDEGLSIAANRNSVAVMGTYENSATFGPFSTSSLYNTTVSYFITNYSFNGSEKWLTEAKSAADDGTGNIFIYYHPKLIFSNDTIFTAGTFGGANMTFINSDASTFGTILTGVGGNQDIFYAALSANGNWIWAREINSSTSSPQLGLGLTADCNGLYISGSLHPNGLFPSGFLLNPAFHDVPFVAKCSRTTGMDAWVKYWNSNVNHEDIANHVKADGKGYLYIMGNYRSSNFFAPDGNLGTVNGTDFFLAKYSTAGAFVSVQAIKGVGDNYINDFSVDGDKISLCGSFMNDITFPPLPLLSGSSDINLFISQGSLSSSPVLYNCCTSPPSAANAGLDLSICTNSSVINATPPSTGIGTWYVVEGANSTGSGVLSNSVAASNSVTGLSFGNNIFTWVVSNNLCNPSIDSIMITVNTPPTTAFAGSSQTLCASNPTVTLSGNNPAVGTGSWSVVSGTASISTPTSPTSAVTALGTGTNILQWTITNGGCPPSTSTVQFVVDPAAGIANAGSNQTICASSPSLILNGNIPATGTGTWSVISGTSSITSPNTATSSATSIGTGTNILQWSISNGVCPASTSTVMIQVDQVPTMASAGSNQTLCANNPSLTLNGNTPSVGTGSWTVVSGTASITSPTLPNSSAVSLAPGNNVLQWSIDNGVCPPSNSFVQIQIDQMPTMASAGSNQTLCSNNPSLTLNGNSPTVGLGLWTVISGVASISSPTFANSVATAVGTGTNILQWSISNGSCPASASTVQINVDQMPTMALAGSNQSICVSSASLNLAGNSPAVGSGIWSVVSGTAAIVTPSSPTSQANSFGAGVNILQWSISNGSCPSSTSTVQINIDQLPSTALAGSNQTLCANNPSLNLNANTPTVGTGSWSVITGTATITSINSPTSSVTSIASGSNILQWSISNGSCPPSTSTVQIQVDQLPTTSIAGSNQTLCANNPSLALGANTPTSGTGSWSVIGGTANIISINSPNSQATSFGTGPNVLQWSITNGSCPASTSTVQINVDQMPSTSFAGSNQTLCVNNPTTTLAANTPALGTGMWSLINGTATITSPSSEISTVTSLASGTNILQWSISNGVCPASTSTMQIQVDDLPSAALAGSDQTLCASSPSLILNGNTPSIGTGSWSVVSGTANLVSPTSPNSAATSIATGTNILQWATFNGVCPSSTSTVQIQVDQVPSTSLAGSNQTICINNPTITLSGNSPSVGTGTWSIISGTANITNINSEISPATSFTTGATVLEWSIANGTCPASTSTVQIQVDDMPTIAMAGSNQTLCANSPSLVLAGNSPAIGAGTWSVLTGTANILAPNSATSTANSISTGTTILEWNMSNGVCPSSTSTVQIQVDPMPDMALAGSSQTLCISNPGLTLSANTPTIGTGMWTVISGTASINTPTLETSTATIIATGTTVLQWSISNGSCPPSTSTVQIQVDDMPSMALAGSNQTLCANSPSITLSGNTPTIGLGSWSVISGTANILNPNLATSSVTSLATGSNVLQWSISNGSCPPSTSTVQIQVDDLPSIALAGSNQTLCANNPNLTLAANTPTIGTGLWSLVSGTATIANPTLEVSPLTSIGTGTTVLQWSVSNGSCPLSTSTMQILVDEMPTIAVAGLSQTICANNPTLTLSANTPSVGAGVWTVMSGTAFITAPNSPTSNANTIATGTNILQWSITNGSCPPSTSTVAIQVDEVPSVAFAGNSQTLCANSYTLNASAPVIGSGTWIVISGTSTVGTNNLPNSPVINLSVGSNILEWMVSNGVCPVSTSTLELSVSAFPDIAAAGTDLVICETDSVQLNANVPAVGTGSWLLIQGGGIISNNLVNNTYIKGLAYGENTFRWTISSSPCPNTFDDVKVTVFQKPTLSNAGPDQIVFTESASLNANLPSVGTGQWFSLNVNNQFSNAMYNANSVMNLDHGNNILLWQISNGVCPLNSDTLIINRLPVIIPNAFSPNSDDVNDVFFIQGIEVMGTVKLNIFNRWGDLVYYNDSYKNTWDGTNTQGTPLSDDTYYFVLQTANKSEIKGYVLLKRN